MWHSCKTCVLHQLRKDWPNLLAGSTAKRRSERNSERKHENHIHLSPPGDFAPSRMLMLPLSDVPGWNL